MIGNIKFVTLWVLRCRLGDYIDNYLLR